jgi:2-amino-4-hydroxy-6-hydroxymethyldihydropteridine diphosphokinase
VSAVRWRPAYVGIGSNLDSPRDQVQRAVESLAGVEDTLLVMSSSLYQSAPLDGSDQPDYVNAVAALLTRLDPVTLLHTLRSIEEAAGRSRSEGRWAPRTLDLDLLVFSNASIDQEDLKLPHPGICERNFVLLPLAEIAPHLRIPGLGSVSGLAAGTDRRNPRIEKLT